jgi:hypothetical protein
VVDGATWDDLVVDATGAGHVADAAWATPVIDAA